MARLRSGTALYRKVSPNKYRNRWTEYNGKRYASKAEAKFAAELDLLMRAGEIKSWRRQVKIPLHVNGRRITNYICDFEIKHNNGSLEYCEVKGYSKMPEWKLKWKLFDAIWPHVAKRIVT